MDSIENGATIRIGFKEYRKEFGDSFDMKIPTYSLKIDKKSVLISEGGCSKDYIREYREAAGKISGLMKEKGVENYVVFNGERVRMSDKLWESCGYIPKDGEEIFKKTLEECLK